MAKLTPLRNFLLRVEEGGKRVYAKKGEKIEVSEQEHIRLNGHFKELYKKKGPLSTGQLFSRA